LGGIDAHLIGAEHFDSPKMSCPAFVMECCTCVALYKYGIDQGQRQRSERFELLDVEGDISGKLRLIYGSGPTDPAR
jgi:hypothetical protein